jgi:hypothetical protein
MPAGRPSDYNPHFCESVMDLGAKGYSQTEIAVHLEVPRTTMLSWAERHPEFSTALTRAKEEEQAWWERTGREAMFKPGFNAAVWKKSMEARFRDDYTERKDVTHNVQPIVIAKEASAL